MGENYADGNGKQKNCQFLYSKIMANQAFKIMKSDCAQYIISEYEF